MKHISFSKKIILSSAFLVVIILCGVFCFGVTGSTNNTKNEGIVTYADLTPFEKQRLEKEIELKENICNFDKENIVEAWVYLGSSDDEITYANIFIVNHEEITNKDELMLLVSESLNLDIKNIYIKSIDVEAYILLGREGVAN